MTVANLSSIAVALSGGLDSTVCALLLQEQGHAVTGLHARLFGAQGETTPGERDAAAMAEAIGIPLKICDLREPFEREVVEPFLETYRQGRTPNPCVLCNPAIKLGALLEHALSRGAAGLATGHYVRVVRNVVSGRREIQPPRDPAKDQSYYLYRLSQRQLEHFWAPLGEWTKEAVREKARAAGLSVADKAESQEICFVPDDDYRGFLEARFGADRLPPPGDIVNLRGDVLGRHKGIHHHTIGQRRGLGISAPRPLYVVAIDACNNRIVVGEEENLYWRRFEVRHLNWVGIPGLEAPRPAAVKIRYRSSPAACVLEPGGAGQVGVRMDEPVRAVTPGQSAVFYDQQDGNLLGGGIIGLSD